METDPLSRKAGQEKAGYINGECEGRTRGLMICGKLCRKKKVPLKKGYAPLRGGSFLSSPRCHESAMFHALPAFVSHEKPTDISWPAENALHHHAWKSDETQPTLLFGAVRKSGHANKDCRH